MTETQNILTAARRLGVPVRILRRAVRDGHLPALSGGALAPLPPGWMTQAEAKLETAPKTLSRAAFQKTPDFARYDGTSAWRKYRIRVREYYAFHAKA